MAIIQCKTQAELDKALADGNYPELVGNGAFVLHGSSQVTAYDSSQVTAYGSSQVRACGSSQVGACGSSQVTAYDSSQVTAYGSSQVTACDSSQVRAYGSSQVTAYDSSQVRACGSSQVRAYGSSQVTATPHVAVTDHGQNTKIDGGVVIGVPVIESAEQWCEFHGVTITKGTITLYKAVRDDFRSSHGFSYVPGTTPVAPDWDNGVNECGGGLHFSPRPFMAQAFDYDATRFVACRVRVADMRTPKASDSYPEKCKARGCCEPVWEVDIDGNRIEQEGGEA